MEDSHPTQHRRPHREIHPTWKCETTVQTNCRFPCGGRTTVQAEYKWPKEPPEGPSRRGGKNHETPSLSIGGEALTKRFFVHVHRLQLTGIAHAAVVCGDASAPTIDRLSFDREKRNRIPCGETKRALAGRQRGWREISFWMTWPSEERL